jgi:hypothetical protein
MKSPVSGQRSAFSRQQSVISLLLMCQIHDPVELLGTRYSTLITQ